MADSSNNTCYIFCSNSYSRSFICETFKIFGSSLDTCNFKSKFST
ncbi:hypothetical protein LI295_12345 [Blautia wexlerae]|nr:hypothetical protein [Blautia wexlerae]MCB8628567.1 hypothetical protein [Blautia sp. DFI.6.71]